MVLIRSAVLAIVIFAGVVISAPLEAQTSATLNVTVRVVQECTVQSKRELVELAFRLNDPGLIRRCSKGVVSRVNQQVVNVEEIQSNPGAVSSPANPAVSKQQVVRTNPNGQTEVVLVTVTY